ncbi:type VII secretion protein EssB/YukC [Companilactobacillus sp. DQM5]|uniref:type VII secretion protein EssB/YukC n=1 Tax=Companilactobacillus sp. DQM5 TaxID=3463359 RepID=UPI004058CF95
MMDAKDADEITSLLQEQYRKVTADQIPVKKKNYAVYKYGFVISIVLLVVLGGFMIYRVGIKEPAQNRVIDSQSAFMSSDYNKTIDILENDNPRKLSKPAQYILATSYINLDNLTNKQKKMLLNNISPQSDSNTLLYWIYTGRGDFKTALNLAKNIGDNQLTLYAYTKLYDVTKADNNMNGSKKQKLLSSYRISIKKYVKELGGKSNGIEK